MSLDVQHYRSEFPVTETSIYMNHAAVSPISRRVRDTMVEVLDDVCRYGAEHWRRWAETCRGVRQSLARLINAEPGEIAFIKNTSEGISSFANGLNWQPGDEIVSVEGEFPANFYPWKALQGRGVLLRLAPAEQGRVDEDAIIKALTPRTRVVTVSFVQYLSGFRLNLEKLGQACEAHGCLLFVDAIQDCGPRRRRPQVVAGPRGFRPAVCESPGPAEAHPHGNRVDDGPPPKRFLQPGHFLARRRSQV